MNLSEADLVERITNALHFAATQVPIENRLWTKAHIGQYINKSEDVVDRMTTQVDFPRAIRIPLAGDKRMHPQWKAKEVIAWVEKHQEKR